MQNFVTEYMRGVAKSNLPEKICMVCGRPFAWRKKWEEVWSEVRYCSKDCRAHKVSSRVKSARAGL